MRRRLLITLSVVVLLILGAAKAYYDTNSIEIKHYQVRNSALGEVLGGLKVAHLSDIHLKDMGSMANKILEILKGEKPDLIFITGDLIRFGGSYEPALSFLHQWNPPYGIYGVLGNADYSNECGSCILCHEERSKRLRERWSPVFLRDSFSSPKVNGRVLNIIGVDDPVQKRSNLKRALKDLNPKIPSILLAHSPEIFDEASNSGIDLLLCGHTHGGQIFLTKYLRKILPLEASLEFIEGFFQRGKMLMYVSRGIGTSYIPFRFGVKPEITFFVFTNNANSEEMRTARINQSNLVNTVTISNNPSKTVFTGLTLTSLMETFSVPNIFDSLHLARARQPRNTVTTSGNPTNSMDSINPKNSINPRNPKTLKIFDFESEEELKQLRWECHKWFELSGENATSGKYALKVTLPPGQYSGVDFLEIASDWSGFRYLKLDFFNPSKEGLPFHIRIDDNKSGWEYANRFDIDFDLSPGMNHLSIPTDSIQTNMRHRPLNLGGIRRMMVFIPENFKRRDLYIDHIRLE